MSMEALLTAANGLGAIDMALFVKALVFFVCGFIGMVAAYAHRWARDKVPVSLWCYLTGDKHETGMALTKLVTACWVAGSFDYLQTLDINAIINAGVLLGMTIPNKVDDDKAKAKALKIDGKQKAAP